MHKVHGEVRGPPGPPRAGDRQGRILPRLNKGSYIKPCYDTERSGSYSAKTVRSMIGIDNRISNLNSELNSSKRMNHQLRDEIERSNDITNTMKTIIQSKYIQAARNFLNNQYGETGLFYRRASVTNIREKNRTAQKQVFEKIFREITDTRNLYKKEQSYDKKAKNAYVIFCGKSTFGNLSFKTIHGKLMLFIPTFFLLLIRFLLKTIPFFIFINKKIGSYVGKLIRFFKMRNKEQGVLQNDPHYKVRIHDDDENEHRTTLVNP